MTDHEREVAARFDALARRFKTELADDDYRLRAILDAAGSVRGLRVLDVGCGKGRFARALSSRGARVVAFDLSWAMLAEGRGLDRVRGMAGRLPFRTAAFDLVIAVEVFEHLEPARLDGVIAEAQRVLRPAGLLLVLDKNAAALDARRPWLPAVAVKRIDELRGRWMYPAGGPVRERWFWVGGLSRKLGRILQDVQSVHPLSPSESARAVFRWLPWTRLMTLWMARSPGGLDV